MAVILAGTVSTGLTGPTRAVPPVDLLPFISSAWPSGFSHAVHASYGKLAIEPRRITLRIRMFKDDLEQALAASTRRPKVVMESTPNADSLFLAYVGEHITLAADGAPLRGQVAGRGLEKGMWWYLIQFPTRTAVTRLALSSRIFFELFNDQQNLINVLDVASGEESSLYFVRGEAGPVTLSFSR